jgi:hypothetical protein
VAETIPAQTQMPLVAKSFAILANLAVIATQAQVSDLWV